MAHRTFGFLSWVWFAVQNLGLCSCHILWAARLRKKKQNLGGIISRFAALVRSPSAWHVPLTVCFCFRVFWCNKSLKCIMSRFYDRSSVSRPSLPTTTTTTTTTTTSFYSPSLLLYSPSVCSSPVGHFALATMTSLSWAVSGSRPQVVWQQSRSSRRGKAAASHRSTGSDLLESLCVYTLCLSSKNKTSGLLSLWRPEAGRLWNSGRCSHKCFQSSRISLLALCHCAFICPFFTYLCHLEEHLFNHFYLCYNGAMPWVSAADKYVSLWRLVLFSWLAGKLIYYWELWSDKGSTFFPFLLSPTGRSLFIHPQFLPQNEKLQNIFRSCVMDAPITFTYLELDSSLVIITWHFHCLAPSLCGFGRLIETSLLLQRAPPSRTILIIALAGLCDLYSHRNGKLKCCKEPQTQLLFN